MSLAEPLDRRVCAHLLVRADQPRCGLAHPGAQCGPACADYRGRMLDSAPGSTPTLAPLDLTPEQRTRATVWQRILARHARQAAASA